MILLDTHALIWWLSDQSKLSPKAKKAIEEAAQHQAIYISVISFWEIATLNQKGRIILNQNLNLWLHETAHLTELIVAPIDLDIAINSTLLPDFSHKDPADRFIIATALSLGFPIVTKDSKIAGYPKIKTVW
jgi:PIN domain nuclease of toxin-antitoxin system